MWDLPGPGLEPVSPALAGGFLTTVPPGKYQNDILKVSYATNDKCGRGCGEKGTLLLCWWECKLVQPLWRTVWRFPKKLKIELPYDPAIPLLGIYLEKNMV